MYFDAQFIMHRTSGTIRNCSSGGIGKIINILPPGNIRAVFTGIIQTRTIEMIKKMLFLFVIVFTFSAIAQESTLISGDIEIGEFDGRVFKGTNINGENAVMVGRRRGLDYQSFVCSRRRNRI